MTLFRERENNQESNLHRGSSGGVGIPKDTMYYQGRIRLRFHRFNSWSP